MKEISTTIHDAKTHLSKYLTMLENREISKLIIKRRNQEVGELSFRTPQKKEIIFGLMKGEFDYDEDDLRISAQEAIEDFDESTENFIQSLTGTNNENST